MDKTLIIVCSAVGSLGVLSAILGFSAEGTKLTPYTILVHDDDCIYPQNPALGLGICAAVFLLAAQVTSTAVGGCCGCCKSRSPSETKRIVGVVCAVVSWIAAAIAWVLLIVGASWNANVVRVAAPYCPYLKDGIFAGAGVLSLAATALGIASYVMTRTQRAEAAAPAPAPAKGEPKIPPGSSAQGNGPHAPNQESPATQESPAEAPQPQAVAPPAPLESAGGLPPVAMGQQQQPATATHQGDELSTVIRNEVTKQGIRLAAKVVEHSLLS
ncbi:hypothetical protein GQ55_3G257800 [Panicum hallii var. hallii]|uniref:Uncharacterized protein n=1 Tax=Panicum hallii var. hallii TaxID=1504633 RepID=A0A2T7EDD3_9POAL|nr:hypothetical protein GQ55_3G257800 [Panicum hallii var. hallii]